MILSNNKCLQNNDSIHWYAFHTKPRQEFKAESHIKDLDIENYLPVIVKKNQWSDRLKEISEPVIRGYIFAKTNESGRLKILEQNAICKCLFDHGKPAIIPEWQIDNLKRFLQTKSEYFISDGIVKGTKVEITNGPFAGVIGVIQSSSGKKTIAVSIELINRTITAYLPKESVEVLNVPANR
jgi:transcription antitermination factor NusG